ncbi:MAG: GxxExxY protein [Parcubacteria group bacterium]|nr:GxxExxY protein [Parcubacteria group bacterium]
MKELLYNNITYDIRGACFSVYKEFGGAFKEKVIERSLILELKKRKHSIESQKRIDIYYLNEAG